MAYRLHELAERVPTTFGYINTTLQGRDGLLSPARRKELAEILDNEDRRQAEAWREREAIDLLRARGLLVIRNVERGEL